MTNSRVRGKQDRLPSYPGWLLCFDGSVRGRLVFADRVEIPVEFIHDRNPQRYFYVGDLIIGDLVEMFD